MNTEQPKKINDINDSPKIDLFEDDDEFEEFKIDENGMKDKEKDVQPNQWEDDWDDDDVNDDFSVQLRKELENNNTEKKNQVGVVIS